MCITIAGVRCMGDKPTSQKGCLKIVSPIPKPKPKVNPYGHCPISCFISRNLTPSSMQADNRKNVINLPMGVAGNGFLKKNQIKKRTLAPNIPPQNASILFKNFFIEKRLLFSGGT